MLGDVVIGALSVSRTRAHASTSHAGARARNNGCRASLYPCATEATHPCVISLPSSSVGCGQRVGNGWTAGGLLVGNGWAAGGHEDGATV